MLIDAVLAVCPGISSAAIGRPPSQESDSLRPDASAAGEFANVRPLLVSCMTHGNPAGALGVTATCLGNVLGTAELESNGAILARIRGGSESGVQSRKVSRDSSLRGPGFDAGPS